MDFSFALLRLPLMLWLCLFPLFMALAKYYNNKAFTQIKDGGEILAVSSAIFQAVGETIIYVWIAILLWR